MSRTGRIAAEFLAAWRAFLRRRTAVFFTFLFPLLLVGIFGVLVETQPTGGGLFTEPPNWYVAGYLAVVVLFTPLSRVGSEVARHRDGNRFEKLATTPLTRGEWLFAQILVNVVVIGLAAVLVLAALVGATGATLDLAPDLALLVPFVAVGVAAFCGLGALLGSYADSQDGVIAMSNAVAIPLLFLSETFVPRSMLPDWLPTGASPLTYFARGVREITHDGAGAGEVVLATWPGTDPVADLGVLAAVAVVLFAVAAHALPRTD